jgi:hypothetical protein
MAGKTHLKKHHSGKIRRDVEKHEKLDRLRRKRLQREESERLKSETLLKQHYGVVQDTGESSGELESPKPRKYSHFLKVEVSYHLFPFCRYNSQFNPSLARY